MNPNRLFPTACAIGFVASLSFLNPRAPAQASTQNFRTLDAAGYNRIASEGDLRGVLLDLNFMRLQPSALGDAAFFDYFIGLNNCGNPRIGNQMNSEFDYPQIASFYKSNAADILKNAPSTLAWRIGINLGQYDPARAAFRIATRDANSQLQPGVSIDHFDPPLNRSNFLARTCDEALQQIHRYAGQSAVFKANGPNFEVTFKRLVFNEIPMDEAAARNYVESLPNSAIRVADLVLQVEILPETPNVVVAHNGLITVTFAGQVKKVTAVKDGLGGETLAVLSPDGDLPSNSQNGGVLGAGVLKPPQGVGAPQNAAQTGSQHSASDVRVFQGNTDSCNAGDAKGCEMVGYSYEHGNGVDKDIQMARQFYQKSCDMGRRQGCLAVRFLKDK
jgi:hypothetical protein